MVEAQQLLVGDSLGVDTIVGVAVVESRTEVKLAVGCQRDVLHARVAVVGLGEHHAVRQQVQLRRASREVFLLQHLRPHVQ